MHFKVNLIVDKGKKREKERIIFVRRNNATEVLDVCRKIRGAKWTAILPITIKEYIEGVSGKRAA